MQARVRVDKVKQFLIETGKAASSISPFQKWVLVSIAALLVAGGITSYMKSRPGHLEIGTNERQEEKDESRELAVHVAGAVMRPGLYEVSEGSRVADALSAAGGPAPGARLDELNLAARLKDGQKVVVSGSEVTQDAGIRAGRSTDTRKSQLVNLNTATAEELEELPGVGPTIAERIVEYRDREGTFSSLEELKNVDGIGEQKIEDIQDLVTI